MTGAEVKQIRQAIGQLLGRRLSQRDLGLALRLSPKNADDTVRSWEDGSRDVTGPASVALDFMRQATELADDWVSSARQDILATMARSLLERDGQ